jgi:SAM-dependent methyltransferase
MEVLFSHASMDDLGAATEDQVILAWLQAEIESPDFQAFIIGNPPNPANLSLALKAARSSDLRDQSQNDLRRQIITAVYGFGQGTGTFEGLANDIRWRRMRLTTDEVSEMLYARREGAWHLLSPVTRKVAEGATNVGHIFTGDGTNMVVLSLASGVCHSEKRVPEIIALRRPGGHLVILEGHARATAIVLEAHRFPNGLQVYVGEGPSVANWPYL